MIATEYHGVKMAYICVPKAGKTSGKSMMAQIRRAGGTLHNHRDHLMSPLIRYHCRDHTCFTIVRDPLKRLMSAYGDRVADRDDISKSGLSVFLCKLFGLNPHPGPEEFVLNLRKYMLVNDRVLRHVIPQVYYTGFDMSYYDAVFNVYQMDEVAEYLAEKTGLGIFPKQNNPGIKKFTLDDISTEAKEYAREFYDRDYRLLSEYL